MPKSEQRIAIVTDSTADLPPELMEKYGIRFAPQRLMLGGNTWLDRIDIDPAAFYDLLQASKEFPTTSQPSVQDFQDIFEDLAPNVDGIVAVLVSSKLSGTVNSAVNAAANRPDIPIEIIDSRGVSMMLGFTVLAAARAAAAGEDLQGVAEAVRAMMGRAHVYFVVDTLEYLHRGGRIGAAARLFGSALNLKPILEMRDGAVTPLTKVRTRRKSLTKMLDLLDEKLAGSERVHMAVVNINASEEAARVREELQERYRPVELLESECSPVVGAHSGPGTVGVAFYAE